MKQLPRMPRKKITVTAKIPVTLARTVLIDDDHSEGTCRPFCRFQGMACSRLVGCCRCVKSERLQRFAEDLQRRTVPCQGQGAAALRWVPWP